MIGLPLRLLAREVYNKVADRVGKEAVALITGEEKIKPQNPRFWVSTVEAMPRDLDVAFMAIDEVQLGADFERGHVFTDRMLNARAATRRWCSAPPPFGRWWRNCCPARMSSAGRGCPRSLTPARKS